jgi:ParB/RepB/Spo0J family partition protein
VSLDATPTGDAAAADAPASFTAVDTSWADPRAIVASTTNPRRTFDQAKLLTLASSLSQQGMLQPILVRPVPAARMPDTAGMRPRPTLEIISGERRWRASQLPEAGPMKLIPVVVRELTDDQVLEAQLVENLQRDDLHPIEEAEGYQRLCDATGITKEQVGQKVGRSRTYVYNRLKLLTLTAESAQAFRDGKLDTSRAELLATIGDTKLQAKALKEFLQEGRTLRNLERWVADNILLKLERAPFDLKAVDLVPGCDACTTCPKRTHADRDLFAAFDGPDLCLDPPCYQGKADAHVAAIRVKAEAEGLQVIDGKAARELRPATWSSDIKGYTRLDASTNDGKGGTAPIAKVLRKELAAGEIKPVVFIDPHDHKPVKVVPTVDLGAALKAKGLIKTTADEREQSRKKAAQRAVAQAAIENEVLERGLDQVGERLSAGALSAFSAELLRLLLVDFLLRAHNDNDFIQALQRMWHLPQTERGAGWQAWQDAETALLAHAQAALDHQVGAMFLQAQAADSALRERYGDDVEALGGQRALFLRLATECGVDLEGVRTAVTREHKAAAKAQSAPGATLQAAPQGSQPAEGDKEGKARPPAIVTAAGGAPKAGARAPRSKRLSAEEAQQGIAYAMQSNERPAQGEVEALGATEGGA